MSKIAFGDTDAPFASKVGCARQHRPAVIRQRQRPVTVGVGRCNRQRTIAVCVSA